MLTKLLGAALLLASSATLANDENSVRMAPDKVEAGSEQLHAAPVCSGSSCPAPAAADHAINEKGTAGTKGCSKPSGPPPSSGGGCNDPCRCPPPN